MISIRARRAWLAEAESGKTSATSGSRTTTLLPAAYRWAYFPRTPFAKSYSSNISGAELFSGSFSVGSPFSRRREPGTDDTDHYLTIMIPHRRNNPMVTKRSSSIECIGSSIVINSQRQRVSEYRGGLLDRHTLPTQILDRFLLIPLESEAYLVPSCNKST